MMHAIALLILQWVSQMSKPAGIQVSCQSTSCALALHISGETTTGESGRWWKLAWESKKIRSPCGEPQLGTGVTHPDL
eukprot:1160922-Pelagomonas_calceolata.AAC.1